VSLMNPQVLNRSLTVFYIKNYFFISQHELTHIKDK